MLKRVKDGWTMDWFGTRKWTMDYQGDEGMGYPRVNWIFGLMHCLETLILEYEIQVNKIDYRLAYYP